MSVPNLGQKLTAILFHQSKDIADQVTANCAGLLRLKSKKRIKVVSGGYQLREPIAYQENDNSQWFDESEVLSTALHQHLDVAKYEWKQLAVPTVITGKEKRMCSGREQLIDLVQEKVSNAKATMKNKCSVAFYSDGTDALKWGGLRYLVADAPATGTVGAIDGSANSFWRNVTYDSSSAAPDGGGAAMSSSNAEEQLTAVWVQVVRGADRPDLMLANNPAWKFLHSQMGGRQRLVNQNSDIAKAGFPSLNFMGADYVLDGGYLSSTAGIDAIDATVGRVFMLNTDYIRLVVHKDLNFGPFDPEERSPYNQDVIVRLLGVMGNLTCSARFLQGVLFD